MGWIDLCSAILHCLPFFLIFLFFYFSFLRLLFVTPVPVLAIIRFGRTLRGYGTRPHHVIANVRLWCRVSLSVSLFSSLI